ncbi:hypothetical protein OKW46_003476 [Paraburkholderia sp. WSM4179]|nr:hypothetical protein [Paraburkholderia sp. WSM4179]
MLKITIELCRPHGPSHVLGDAEIENVSGDEEHADYVTSFANYGDYAVTLREGADEHEVGPATLTSSPRFGGTVWDFVARGVATASAGKEGLPPRPVFPWR